MTFGPYFSKKDASAVRGELFQQAPYKHEPGTIRKRREKGDGTERHTIGKTCSFLSTKHSINTGFEPSYSKNSFILAGSSSAE